VGFEALAADLREEALKLCPYNPESIIGRCWVRGFLEPNFVSDFGSRWLGEGRQARYRFDGFEN
jgi:hypothetical protein